MATLYAGTSGYAYPAWKPGFYPEDVPATRFLQHYASRLNCVEINYTFRHMPSEKTVTSWVAATPPGFMFVLKAHQAITHRNRLKEGAREPLEYFLGTLAPLRDAGRLGPVLLQLPPNLKLDLERLERFLGPAAAATCASRSSSASRRGSARTCTRSCASTTSRSASPRPSSWWCRTW